MGEITELLRRAARGESEVHDPLYRLLYPELMQLACIRLANAGSISLDPGEILHEAWLRMVNVDAAPKANRRAFFGYASHVMRSVIVDYVRGRDAVKRGGDQERVTISGSMPGAQFLDSPIDALDQAMTRLKDLDERVCRVVEMRYFGGMTEHEIADVLDVSVATVQRDWRKARMFLFEQLGMN
jgi:RNA polymerase sigma factor (TIGR02999 family)